MIKWGFVICTQNEKLKESTTLWIDKFFSDNIKHFLTEENSIFTAYNKGIKLTRNCKYVCFVHEDIDLINIDLPKLEKLLIHKDTGFVGVAGAKILNTNGCWWDGYKGKPLSYLSGKAGHQKIENNILKRWYNNYGEFGQVQVLDGLILFCNRILLDRIKWEEDTYTGFDFYDIDITYKAYKSSYLNYTFENIELYHWGLGYPRNTWNENRLKFLEKLKI